MLQGIIVKKVLDLVIKQILKKFNLDKIQKYVEEPNELDKKVKALEKKLPALHSATGKAFVKWFTPDANWTWYVMEYDPKTGECFGLVDGLEKEFGYFSITELESITRPFGLRIERDIHFTPTKISTFM